MEHSGKLTAVLLGLLLSACYSPTYPEGRICAPDGTCPGDLVCDVNFLCFSPENAGEVIPPDPPFPPDFPRDSYGRLCFEEGGCPDGLTCFIDPRDPDRIGFCTPMCVDFEGDINEEICQYVDPGQGTTMCGVIYDLETGEPPGFCATFCQEGTECPQELVCAFDEQYGTTMCKVPF